MPKILITGGSGFIGENLAHGLLSQGFQVFLAYGTQEPCTRAEKIFRVDLFERGDFSRALGDLAVDAVVHAAAMVSPDACEKDPVRAHAVNVEGTREVCRWAEERGATVLYFSTDLVYDGHGAPYAEDDTPNPVNVYGRTKLAGEDEVRRICSRWISLRLALSYGPARGRRGDWTAKMRHDLRQGKSLTLFTDQYRTPAYAGDTVQAVSRLLSSDELGIYHMGGAERISRYAFGRTFARIFRLPLEPFRAVRMSDASKGAVRGRDCSLVTDKLTRVTGLPLCNVEQGLLRQMREEAEISALPPKGSKKLR